MSDNPFADDGDDKQKQNPFDGASPVTVGNNFSTESFYSRHEGKYCALWKEMNPSNTGTVSGAVCAPVFKKTGLSTDVLAQIWEEADKQQTGFLDREDYFVCLGLIGLALKGETEFSRAKLMEMTNVAPPDLTVSKERSFTQVAEKPKSVQKAQVVSPAYNVIVTIHAPKLGSVVKHTEYHVYTEPNGHSVIRRYSDFIWLAEILEKKYPYCVLPALPPKQFFGRFEDKFLSQRRRGLEKFINRLAGHPVMYDAEVISLFLKQDEKEFAATKTNYAAVMVTPPAEYSDKKYEQSNDIEVKFKSVCDYIESVERGCNDVYVLDERLMVNLEDRCQLYKRMSEVLPGILCNGDDFCWDPLCTACRSSLTGVTHMATFVDHKLRALVFDQSDREYEVFGESLRDYFGQAQGIKNVHKRRLMFIRDLQTVEKRLQKNKTRLAAAAIPERPKIEPLVTADEVALAQLNGLVAYTTSQLLREIGVFHSYKAQTMYNMINKYAQTSIDYHENMVKQWKLLLPELKDMPKNV